MIDPEGDAALEEWFRGLTTWDAGNRNAGSDDIQTLHYGAHPDQHLDLWSAGRGPMVVSIHGGYFLPEYDLSLNTALSRALASDGFTVANVEYRRGSAGPDATIADVHAAVDAVAGASPARSVAVIGHSAGGYLALRLADHPSVGLIIALAPVSDLADASRAGWDDGGIAQWLGARPDDDPEIYRAAGVLQPLPSDVRCMVLHGSSDSAVDVAQSRALARKLSGIGADIEYLELAGEGHYGYLDPREPAFRLVRDHLREWRGPEP